MRPGHLEGPRRALPAGQLHTGHGRRVRQPEKHTNLREYKIITVCVVLLGVYKNMRYTHPAQSKLVCQAAKTEEALHSPIAPHAKDDNQVAVHHQTIPGGRPSEQGPRKVKLSSNQILIVCQNA